MDIIHLSERDGEQRHSGLGGTKTDGGPSIEDIVHSMRNHLLCPTGGDSSDTECDSRSQLTQTGSRSGMYDSLNMPGNQLSDGTNVQKNDSILRLLNGQRTTSSNQRGLTEEEVSGTA